MLYLVYGHKIKPFEMSLQQKKNWEKNSAVFKNVLWTYLCATTDFYTENNTYTCTLLTVTKACLFIYSYHKKITEFTLNSINNWRKGNKIETMKCNTRIESKQDLNHTKAQKQQNLFSQSIGMNWMGCLLVCEFTIHHLSTKHSQ